MWFTDINNIWMVPLYPLAAFLLTVLGRSLWKDGLFARKEISMALTIAATFMGLLHSVFAIGWLLGQDTHHLVAIEENWTWLRAGDFRLSLGYLLDSMSVMMLFVVTFISLLIQIYTHGYMSHDEGYAKFFGYLALFNFSMLGLVLSTNLFQIYIFWELVGVSSYLLIGFWFTRPSAASAAVKAFLMNRVGDFGFLFGILGLLYFTYPAWSGYLAANPEQALLSFQAMPAMADVAYGAAGPALFALIAFLLFMGPMAKSAQVPLHTWLPDAMEGPTPISALIHAATMVAAGVFLIGRTYPIFTTSEVAMWIVAIIGTLTAVIAATIAIVQYDIKKALAYSTMSQLGFMVAAMGLGAFTAGLFHLFTHAFFKAMLFLCSGSVIHACEDEQDMRRMGGLMKKLPGTGWTYLIGTMAISGLLWTSGFWSKDAILITAGTASPPIYWILSVTAGVTAFYMFRTFFLTFMGDYRGQAHVHHETPVMVWPLIILAIPSLFIGLLLSGSIEAIPAFGDFIREPGTLPLHEEHHGIWEAITSPVGIGSLIAGVTGLVAAWFLYATAAGVQVAEMLRTAPVTRSLHGLFANKWYFDDMYRGFVDRVYLVFANGSASFDTRGIDGLVNWTGRTVTGSGYLLRQLHSGRVQTYIITLFFGVVILALLLFYGLA